MSKIVLVETISMFRHVYAVEIGDEDDTSLVENEVVLELSKDNPKIEEVGQKWISEETISHREVDEKEYLRVFDELSSYLYEWSDEEKKRFIYKKSKESDDNKGLIKDWEC